MALERNGHADAAEFIRWRCKHGLSLTAAAEALGLSRHTIAYYVSAEQEVPRTVLLALSLAAAAAHRSCANKSKPKTDY